ncbi:alginate lyase family protein [Pinibacter soli]|uniref:Alginate lyase family protein n=1 Tax=Pinibacter soli TaxID=3044211 RepID=A0ABT6RBV7_9BACT|nr:alginate lyase family protein [Pinibacter soli]MDI3320045.1 alginate lyase family protein [Pinibacter soli]
MNKKLILSAFVLLAGISSNAQYTSFNRKEISNLKSAINSNAEIKKYYVSFQNAANAALNESPNPIDTIRSEGLLQGDPKKTATQNALKDMPKIYALSLVYKINGDKKYLAKAIEYFKAWATKTTPNGDPIDDTNLDRAIEGYDLIKEDIKGSDAAVIKEWWRKTGELEITAKYNNPERMTSKNNWNAHRLKIIGEIAWSINDEHLKQYAIEGFKKHLEVNLKADGSSIDFEERDALHYHVYDLEPLIKLCIVLRRATNTDYYSFTSPSGTSVEKSVTWLLPYVTGEKTHGEYTNSKVEFDRKRAANNEGGFKIGAPFDPKHGVNVLLLAAYFHPAFLDTAKKVLGTDEAYPSWQSVSNEMMRN